MRRCELILVLVSHLAVGCSGGNSDPEQNSGIAEQPDIVTPGSEAISVPFEGVIRARQWYQTELNSSEVTYTIRHDTIRRDVVSSNLVDRAIRSNNQAGVICHPADDKVILYRARGEKKRYCTISLAEYREHCEGQSSRGISADGFGCMFCDLPESGSYLAESETGAVTIGSLRCDRLVINFGSEPLVIIEAEHCPVIQVERELLALVELNLPDELTGFPMRLGRVETLRRLKEAHDESDERYKQILVKAAQAISDGLEKITEYGLRVEGVEVRIPDNAAFELSSDFTPVTGLAQLEAEFEVSSGGGGWDD